jgi:hypothetical protein
MYIDILLITNGLYDILCAISIIMDVGPLKTLHTALFTEKIENPLTRHLLAYWIFTYGNIRLLAGIQSDFAIAAAVTYFIEALCFEYESRIRKSTVTWKTDIVALLSVAIGMLVFFVHVSDKITQAEDWHETQNKIMHTYRNY